MSHFSIHFLLIFTFNLCVQSQVVRKEDRDDQQQVIKPVERINLRDFGISQKTDRIKKPEGKAEKPNHQREDEPKVLTDTFDTDIWSSPRRTGLLPRRESASETSDSTSRRRPSSRDFTLRRINDCSNCVDSKYLLHYYAKGCTPRIDSYCKCPTSFDCPQFAKNSTVCQYDGRTYTVGSRIPVRNPCRICECRDFGRRRGEPIAEIDCGIGIECPEEAFGVRPESGCYFFYEREKCCGRHECPNKLGPKRDGKFCKYDGKEYKLGQRIYPKEDHCKTCYCTEDWDDINPLSTNACQTYRCDFELDRDFKSGCTPIYHESTCCPIEYKCPERFTHLTETSSPNMCVFEGKKYPIGSKMDMKSQVCIECTCKVPPDFTCVHKNCPSPDGPNCFVEKWDNNVCCQRYTCRKPGEIRDESQLRGSSRWRGD